MILTFYYYEYDWIHLLLQEQEFIKTKENIYKIGKTR